MYGGLEVADLLGLGLPIAQDRAHILEGYKIAIKHLDAIIKLIRASTSPVEAKEGLINTFDFSERQAQSILELQLQRLTALERDKIDAEYLECIKAIEYFLKEKIRMELQLIDTLKLYFPAALKLFCDITNKISLAFLSQYPTPGKARKLTLKRFQAFFKKHKYTKPGRVEEIFSILHELFVFSVISNPISQSFTIFLIILRSLSERPSIVIVSYPFL